ncbi:ShlB/FhaC/HecB family hemolysin secretion/activation protein [Marinobacter bohaiensis]|uniref:ShlB/FhaC/HecB family hemolysin secretion/activation protein n=1 Tax=Marinobacter bohaiensis TaxID=2201898 RepID=UPI0013A70C34|nr:ShlB/FhaC/HecB family hemolysin secretion/activation protein [Marinobacter bohaiensis]
MPGLQLLSKRVVTRVYALVQPNTAQCLDPERLDGLASRINDVLEREEGGQVVVWLPQRPIVGQVLTLRFKDAKVALPDNGDFPVRRPASSRVERAGEAGAADIVVPQSLPSYTFGRWTPPAGTANVAAVESAKPTERGQSGPSFSLQHVQQHWLGSHLQLAGSSSRSREGHSGRIGLEADDLIEANHAMRFNFNESGSQRVQNEAEAFAFHYAFPLAGNSLSMDVDTFSYQSTVTGDESKYEARGEGRNLMFSGRRSLFSWSGINFDSVLGVRNQQATYHEKGEWVEDSSRQLSMFTLEGSTSRELLFDVTASTRFAASSGMEMVSKDYDDEDGLDENDGFQKYVLSGSLSRQLFDWQLDFSGHYQFTPDDLPDSQYFTVVGPAMISGFNGQSITAAKGGWLRLDANSPRFTMPMVSYLRSALQFSLLRGWIPDASMQADRAGSASAAEVSLRFQGRGIQAGFSVGRMLGASSDATDKPDVPDVSLSLSVGL